MVFATNQVRHVLVQNSATDGPELVLQQATNENSFKIIQKTPGSTGTFISASDSIDYDKIISISSFTSKSPFKVYTADATDWASEGSDVAYLKVNIYEGSGSVNFVSQYIPYVPYNSSNPDVTNINLSKLGLGLVWNDTDKTLSQTTLASTAAGKSGIIYFSVSFVDANLKGLDIAVTESEGTALPGYMVKKLEEFCNSFKGDMNFGVGFPYCSDPVPTYADPNAEYEMLNIHYYYEGSNEAVQKSEKDLTLCVISTNSTTNVIDILYPKLTALGTIKVMS